MGKLLYVLFPYFAGSRATEVGTGQIRCYSHSTSMPKQAWFSAAMGMLTHLPIFLPRTPDLLTLSHAPHPLYPNMELMACRVSGRP